jgi:hypothetical protein
MTICIIFLGDILNPRRLYGSEAARASDSPLKIEKCPSLWLVGHSNSSVGGCLSASEILLQWSFHQCQGHNNAAAAK